MSEYMNILNSPYLTPDQQDRMLEAPEVPTNAEVVAANLETISFLTELLASTSDPDARFSLCERISYLELMNIQRTRRG